MYLHEFQNGWAVVNELTGEHVAQGYATREEAQGYLDGLKVS